MQHRSLYFIAIVPPPGIKDEIQSITENISDKFNTTKALNSEPHITLIPPFWYPDKKVDVLKSVVSQLIKDSWSFPIILNGYDTFPARVLFVSVEKSEELQELYERAHGYLPVELRSKIKKYRDYHPHITVAFKDIDQKNFIAAKEEYQDKPYDRIFEMSEIILFRHNGKSWRRAN